MKSNRGTTPFPNLLLDVFMPRLKDTEWRLLCVIVRQTLGWQAANGERKVRDWLSHGQLKRKTGRASAAVSEAIQGLLEKGLIAVRDEEGNTVHLASSRRKKGIRLYFSLSSGLNGLIHTISDFKAQNPKTTKQNETKKERGGDLGGRLQPGWRRAISQKLSASKRNEQDK